MRIVRALIAALALAATGPALAQSGGTLPVPADIPQAAYPPELLQAGEEGRVVLELDISAKGFVLDARIAEGTGRAFDQAVLDVALSWRFEPATDAQGNPVPATIQYAYTFEASRAQAGPQANLTGTVVQAGTRQPLAGALVQAIDADGAVRYATEG